MSDRIKIRLYGGPCDGKEIYITPEHYHRKLPVTMVVQHLDVKHPPPGKIVTKQPEYLYEARLFRDGTWRWVHGYRDIQI